MNLLIEQDIKNKEYFNIILMINAVKESRFGDFIEKISDKCDWIEELCCCYFQNSSNGGYYLFETFEGEDFQMPYDEFVEYVKLAITRYLLACKSQENIEYIRKTVRKTVFAKILDNLDQSVAIGIPLVHGH